MIFGMGQREYSQSGTKKKEINFHYRKTLPKERREGGKERKEMTTIKLNIYFHFTKKKKKKKNTFVFLLVCDNNTKQQRERRKEGRREGRSP